ncbi:MAG TPA: amidohydrolase family protein, partial [Bacteroidales bacterium]|nr:amidohydrolase family protein [Bacteroidales bacterium]
MDQLLILNGTIVNSETTFEADILVKNGTIAEIGKIQPSAFPGSKIIDAKGKLILPGGIDPHVHLQLPTPAGPSCDDFISGSKAALAGGTTFVIDFVTPARGESLVKALTLRLKESNNCLLDYTLHMGITWYNDSIPEQMQWCVNEVGIKSF